jgi:hypothetical protein
MGSRLEHVPRAEAAAATIAAISISIAIRDGYAPILDALGVDAGTENPVVSTIRRWSSRSSSLYRKRNPTPAY